MADKPKQPDQHSSAPGMGRKKEPMITPQPGREPPKPVPGTPRRRPGEQVPPDEET